MVEKTIGSIEYTIGEETKTIAVNDTTSFIEETNIANAEISKIVVKDTEGNPLPSSFTKTEDNWVITMNTKLSEEEIAKYPSDTYTIHLNYIAPKKIVSGLEVVGSPNKEVVFGFFLTKFSNCFIES